MSLSKPKRAETPQSVGAKNNTMRVWLILLGSLCLGIAFGFFAGVGAFCLALGLVHLESE